MYMNYIPYTDMDKTNPNSYKNKDDNILPKPLVLHNDMKQSLISNSDEEWKQNRPPDDPCCKYDCCDLLLCACIVECFF